MIVIKTVRFVFNKETVRKMSGYLPRGDGNNPSFIPIRRRVSVRRPLVLNQSSYYIAVSGDNKNLLKALRKKSQISSSKNVLKSQRFQSMA